MKNSLLFSWRDQNLEQTVDSCPSQTSNKDVLKSSDYSGTTTSNTEECVRADLHHEEESDTPYTPDAIFTPYAQFEPSHRQNERTSLQVGSDAETSPERNTEEKQFTPQFTHGPCRVQMANDGTKDCSALFLTAEKIANLNEIVCRQHILEKAEQAHEVVRKEVAFSRYTWMSQTYPLESSHQ